MFKADGTLTWHCRINVRQLSIPSLRSEESWAQSILALHGRLIEMARLGRANLETEAVDLPPRNTIGRSFSL